MRAARQRCPPSKNGGGREATGGEAACIIAPNGAEIAAPSTTIKTVTSRRKPARGQLGAAAIEPNADPVSVGNEAMRDAASPIEPKPAGGGWEVRGDTVAEIPQGLGVVGHSVADQTGPDHAGIDDDGAVAIDDHADATDQALIDAAADDNAAAVGHAEHADKIVIEIDPHVAAGFISQRYDLEFRGWVVATTPVEEVTLFDQGRIASQLQFGPLGPGAQVTLLDVRRSRARCSR